MPPVIVENIDDPLYKDHNDLNLMFINICSLIIKFHKLWKMII